MTSLSRPNQLEEGTKETLDFSKLRQILSLEEDVLPVVVQDSVTREVLILAYINRLALEESLRTGVATFWSTSRNKLWIKGATSGNILAIADILINCEQNSLVFLVTPQNNGACHTKDVHSHYRIGCYYRRIKSSGELEFV